MLIINGDISESENNFLGRFLGEILLKFFWGRRDTSGLPSDGFIPQPSPRPEHNSCFNMISMMMMMIKRMMKTFWEDLAHSQEGRGQPNDACLENYPFMLCSQKMLMSNCDDYDRIVKRNLIQL